MASTRHLALPLEGPCQTLADSWRTRFRSRGYDPGPALRSVKVPVLALVGEQDDYSPPIENLDPLRRLRDTPDKTLKVILGATHDFRVVGASLPLTAVCESGWRTRQALVPPLAP